MTKNNLRTFKKIVMLIAPLAFFGCHPCYAAPTQTYSQPQKSPEETIKALQKLTQYAIDESFLISQCIDNVKDPSLKTKLMKIKGDSDDNLRNLFALIKKYGGEVPEFTKDFKGYFLNGYAAMRGAFTDKGVLNALDTNLKLILKAFESVLNSSLPSDAKDAVTKIYESKKSAIKAVEAEI